MAPVAGRGTGPCWNNRTGAAPFQSVVRLWPISCRDPNRRVAVWCAGADAQGAGNDVDTELPALHLAGDDPAAGRRLPAPTGDPGLKPTDAGPVVEQDAGV